MAKVTVVNGDANPPDGAALPRFIVINTFGDLAYDGPLNANSQGNSHNIQTTAMLHTMNTSRPSGGSTEEYEMVLKTLETGKTNKAFIDETVIGVAENGIGHGDDTRAGQLDDTKPGQLSNTKKGQLDDMDTKPGQLDDTDTKPGQLSDTKPGQLSDTKTGQLDDTDTKPGQLSDTKPGQLSDTYTKPGQLDDTDTKPGQLDDTKP